MNLKKTLSILLILCMIISVFAAVPFTVSAAKTEVADTGAKVETAETGAGIYGLVDNIQQGQILQCWNWSYQNIARNMSLIAQQGFSAIQTSPIQATKETTREFYNSVMNSSWVVYQPVSFAIEQSDFNALGKKADFEYMCEQAHKYGVKVIVDVIFNHTANDMSGNTIHPWVPSEIKDNPDCWHDISKNIYNFDNRYDVTQYCLTGLPDLNTGHPVVQKHCINLLKEAIDAGADGFRIDAAKHIETDWDADGTRSDFWKNVIGAANSYAQETRGFTPYYYGEVLGSPGGGLSIEAYTRYMSVSDPGSSDTIRNGVCNGDAAAAVTGGISCGAAKDKAVQWTESHDNHKDSGTSYLSDDNINKTWALVGSKNEVCGMYLARPEDMNTTLMGEADHTSWTLPAVKAVNNFKNHFVGQGEYLSSYNQLACVERGNSGMIIVNTGGTFYNGMSAPVHTMAAGTYTDAITGNTFTVSGGYITGDIGDTGVAVVYNVADDGEFTKGQVTDVSISGSFNGWDSSADRMIAIDRNTVTTSMYLDKGTYTFKVSTTNGIWYGNSGVIEDTTKATSETGWEMSSANSDDCTLEASGGKYTFTFNVSTGMLVVDYEDTTDTTSSFYLKGSFNDWGTTHPMEYMGGGNIVATTIQLPAGTYTFKLNYSDIDVWYGNSGTITDTTGSGGWVMNPGEVDCTLKASGGAYKFSFDLSTQKLTVTTDAVIETTATEATEVTTETQETTTAPSLTSVFLKGSFNGWTEDNPMSTTTDPEVITATLNLEAGEYTFKINDGDIWYGNGGTIEDTTEATSPVGWEMDAGAGDCTLTASGGTYIFNFNTATKFLILLHIPAETDPQETTFTVTFKDYNGMILSEQKVDKGMAAQAPESPTRPADAQYTYTFKEWDTDFSNITENTVVTAVYDSKINVYTVAFMDSDGTVLDTQQVEYGNAATAPEVSEKDGLVFTGWDIAFDYVTKDITVTATYRERGEVYIVKFVDFDGTVLSTQEVEAGSTAVAPEIPVRDGYAFLGWDKDFHNVKEDLTITATYAEAAIFLMGSFNEWQKNDPMIPAEEDGDTVSVKLDLEPGTYYFKILQDTEWFGNPGVIEDTTDKTSADGWAMEVNLDNCTLEASGGLYEFRFNTVTGKLIVLYTAPTYTVTFVDYDGTVLSTQQIVQGKNAKSPEYPERESNIQYTYIFSGWDKEYTDIRSDLTITATYTRITNKYTVTFVDFDGTVLRTQQVEYGNAAVAPASPNRTGYTFSGWDNAFSTITGDLTVAALYRKKAESIVVTTGFLKIDIISGTGFRISINGSADRRQGVNYFNSQVDYNSNVTITANTVADREFIGWVDSTNGKILTTDYTYTFTTTGKDYLKALYVTDYEDINTVMFINDKAAAGNGQILDMQYYVAGEEIQYPDDPAQVGYVFDGWNMTDEQIQAELAKGNDVTLIAKWIAHQAYVDVEVIGGRVTKGATNAAGQYRIYTAIELAADSAPAGKKFAYWTINGEVKSYAEEFKCFPTEAITIEAVFVDADNEIEYNVLVNVDAIDTETNADKNVFIYSWYVPEAELGITYEKSGILAVNKANYTGSNLVVGTTDTSVYDRSPAGTSAATAVGTYSWTKSDVTEGQIWVAVAYVQYVTATGEKFIVYSDIVEAVK